MEENASPRSINELADLPYSEMTEEEIEIMVEWRAENKARDEHYRQAMEALHERSRELAAIARQSADEARQTLEELRDRARKRYEEASKDNG